MKMSLNFKARPHNNISRDVNKLRINPKNTDNLESSKRNVTQLTELNYSISQSQSKEKVKLNFHNEPYDRQRINISIIKGNDFFNENNDSNKKIEEEFFEKKNSENENNLVKNSNSKIVDNSESDTNNTKDKCESIFNRISNYNKFDKVFEVGQQTLFKIIKDLGLFENKYLKMCDLDVLIKKLAKNRRSLKKDEFFNFLIHLSKKIDSVGYSQSPKVVILNIVGIFENYLIQKSSLIESEDQNSKKISFEVFEDIVFKYTPEEKLIKYIDDIYSELSSIYKCYFNSEINDYFKDNNKVKDYSLNKFYEFLHDFEIIPFNLNINQASMYWKLIFDQNSTFENVIFNGKQNYGKIFTLKKFALALIHLSIIIYENILDGFYKETPYSERLLLFLQKLERSKGITVMLKKTSRCNLSKFKLVPKQIYKKESYQKVSLTTFRNKTESNEKFKKIFNQKDDFNILELLDVSNSVKELIQNNLEILKDLFFLYSKYSDKFTMNKMSVYGFIRFLKDTDSIEQTKNLSISSSNFNKSTKRLTSNTKRSSNNIFVGRLKDKMSESDAVIIFSNLTGIKNFNITLRNKSMFSHNKGYKIDVNECHKFPLFKISDTSLDGNKLTTLNRMDLNLFIKSFESIAKKLYPNENLDEAIVCFFNNNLQKIFNQEFLNISYKGLIMDLLQYSRNEQINEISRIISSTLEIHFNNYAEGGFLDFERFYNFCKEFDIFPDVISLPLLKTIFFTLSEILSSNLKSSDMFSPEKDKLKPFQETLMNLFNNKHLINYELFLDSIGIISNFMKYHEEYSQQEKYIALIEKINKSEGINHSQKRNGHPLKGISEFSNSLKILKTRFPEYFEKKHGKPSQEMTFSSVFN